jgi:pimeloyl-ACP methyl ester carboxylesterase
VQPAMLAHTVEGNGPPLLLLNGGLMSLHAWDPLAARLGSRVTVVRCDLRGQLLTPGTPPPTLEGHAQDVARLVDHLAVDAVHVVGTSFGALVGLTLAACCPDRVRSLVAITATDRVTGEMWLQAGALAEACSAAAAGGDGGAVFDLVVPGTFSPSYRHRFAEELAARRQVIASLPREWFAGLEGLLGSLRGLDLRPMLPKVTCPTLVLGAGRDQTFPLWHSQSLASGLPDAQLRIVPGAPHGLILEEPEVVAGSILEFLTRIGALSRDADPGEAAGQSRGAGI